MARRLFNGRAFSEDGWPYVDEESCTWIVVPGTNPPVHLQIQNGPPLILLGAWAADWNAYIEPLRDADSACWTPGNSVPTSNHPGGTAEDLNWESHDFQVRGTLNAAQMATMAEMEAFYEGNVFWAGRWQSPVDEMHSQMGYDTYDQDNDRPFPKVIDFIRRKIRSDGFSTFRRGTQPPPPPPAAGLTQDTLARAMGSGVALTRYEQLLQPVRNALAQSGCAGNLNRLAMWLAQIGHESGGLKYMEEIASGAAYEGRLDLGNTQPGDGIRFKGRGPIQVTGRGNYTRLSQWAFGQKLIPSATFFVDQPAQLASDQYGFLGAVWYWTVARPQINALCDAGDLEGVTRAINGGLNGLEDRRTRWDRCRAMGLAALDVSGTPPPPPPPGGFLMALSEQEQRDVYNWLRDVRNALFAPRPPENIYRETSETVGQNLVDSIRSTLSMTYEGVVERLALLGESASINKVVRVARGEGPEQRPWAIDRAKLIWQKGLAGSAASTTAARVMPTPIAMAPPPPLPAPAAPDRLSAELADAYTEIGRLRELTARLQEQAQAAPVGAEVAVIEPVAPTTGESAARIIDSVQDWTKVSLAMDRAEQLALDVAVKALQMQNQNGVQQ